MKNKLTAIFLSLCLVICFAGCGQSENKEKAESYGIHHAVITFEGYGEIELELDGEAAPITVKNFVKLAKEGFYDGLTIHRIVENFVIQGGDPEANGTGGSEEKIIGEFSDNGYENNISHKRGVISMARRSDSYDSASSQFFIVLHDSAVSSLDGSYAAFGKVTKGMEIIDRIVEETPISDFYSGLVDTEKQPVIKSIEIID